MNLIYWIHNHFIVKTKLHAFNSWRRDLLIWILQLWLLFIKSTFCQFNNVVVLFLSPLVFFIQKIIIHYNRGIPQNTILEIVSSHLINVDKYFVSVNETHIQQSTKKWMNYLVYGIFIVNDKLTMLCFF